MDFVAARRNMVDCQIRPNDVTDPRIVRAFLAVEREAFLPKSRHALAYAEAEPRTSDGRALWTPRDTAKLIKAVDPQPSEAALVVAAGAGYEAALLTHLCETVIALEDSEERVASLTERFARLGLDRAVAVQGELEAGLPDEGPFGIIVICGMVEHVPDALTGQLAEGGRLAAVVEVDDALGQGRVYARAGGVAAYRVAFDATPPKLNVMRKPRAFVF